MAGDEFLGSLADPKATPKKSAAPAAKGKPVGGLFDQLMTTLNDIEDPFTRSIVQGAMEAKISDRIGQQFHFPDPGEQELQATRTQRQLLQEQIETSKLAVQLTQAEMLNLDDAQRASLGIEPGEDIFQTDPEGAVRVSQDLQKAGRLSFALTLGDLKLAGLPTNEVEAQSMGEKRLAEQQQKLGAQAGAARDQETIAASFAKATEGEGPIGESATAAMDAAGEDSDVDEDRGSELLHNMISNAVSDLGQTSGQGERFVASSMLAGKIGDRLRDELEGLDTSDGSDNGLLVVGKGDKGVTDNATFYLAATAMDLFQAAGVTDTEGMRLLKLPYSGFDLPSVIEAGDRIAKERGVNRDALFQSLGPRFMDAARLIAAKETLGAQAVKGKK